MKKLLIILAANAVLAVGFVSEAPPAATAKPTTTTAAPTTTLPPQQVLGIPHVIEDITPFPNPAGTVRSLTCPAAEVALSFASSTVGAGPGGFFASSDARYVPYRTIQVNGLPVGYEWLEPGGFTYLYQVTCAPVVNI